MVTDEHNQRSTAYESNEFGDLEFLMCRLNQLLEDQIHTNQIIHNTFYISVIVFGALLGAIPQIDDAFARGGLYLFGAIIFIAMYGWTKTYLNTRRVNEERQNDVLEAIRKLPRPDSQIKPVGDFFSDPGEYRQDRWEQNWRKELLLQIYYAALAVIALVILLIDVGIEMIG